MYGFTNRFSGLALRHRIGMMNRRRSDRSAWARYVVWVMLLGVMVLACRHRADDGEFVLNRAGSTPSPTNESRRLTAELDKQGAPWFRQSALFDEDIYSVVNGKRVVITPFMNYPNILCARNDQLALKLRDGQRVTVFVNGQQATSPEKALAAIRFEEVADMLIYQKRDDALGAEKYPESHRLFISTTRRKPLVDLVRSRWSNYLKAAAVSDHPLGKASTFSMNRLLEATFFSNLFAFVERTKDDHLTLYGSYKTDIDLFINGLPATEKDIEGVHIREVDRLYANERSFEEWVDGPERKSRFVLYIQTAPKRAKRDSSYYVFSPFYSGDF